MDSRDVITATPASVSAADDPEWWEGLRDRARSRAAESTLLRRVRRASVVAVWLSVCCVVGLLVFWPAYAWGVRAWIGLAWVLVCWSLLARTRTVRISTVLRVFGLSIPWAFGIGLVSVWAIGWVGA